jgi:CheY-like chemotaxis protein
MKVLLVEDVEDSRGALRAMIERLGHHVIEATNGKEAVQATIDHNPECVLMDLALPEVDGLQATAAIRAISRFEGRLPIIAMTAFHEAFSQDKAFRAGCDGYLRKPIDLDNLRDAFKEFCGA